MGTFSDWRSLAVGACALILVLVGVLDRWAADKSAHQSALDERQWEYIRDLTDKAYANKERLALLESRIVQLERGSRRSER